MTNSPSQSWSVVASWIAAGAIGWLFGFGIVGNLGVPVLLGLSFGLILGLAQFPLVRRFADAGMWLASSAFGWGLGFVVATGIAYLWSDIGLSERQLMFLLLWGGLGGGLTAAARYFLTKGGVRRTSLFLAVVAIASVAGLVSQYILASGLDHAIRAARMADGWAVAAYAVSGAAYGAITAPYVLYLWRTARASSATESPG